MTSKTILRVVSKILIPYILMFALYTQFHGDFGPGGGFQAGVILAAAVVLFGLVFGIDRIREVVSDRTIEVAAASGVLIYGGVGVVSLAAGGNYLDYNVLHPEGGHHGQHLGILLVELGVGLTDSAVMVAVFAAFVDRARERA